MNFIKFLAWFIGGLVGTMFLLSMINNNFIVSLFVACVLGFLGAKDET